MGQLALLITWILFIAWGLSRYGPAQQWIAIVFMAPYYILFLISVLAFRTSRKSALTYGEIQQVIINNTSLYIAAIIVFGYGSVETELATTTGFMILLTGLLALISSKIFSSEIVLQRLLTCSRCCSFYYLSLFNGMDLPLRYYGLL